MRLRNTLATVAIAAAGVGLGAQQAAATSIAPGSPLALARLGGQVQLAGVVTVAKFVPGEYVGQPVARTWTFVPGCPTGACDTIGLARTRATGTDLLVLYRLSPGYYVGTGRFFAPLECGGRAYPQGSAVPFTITVRVTAARVIGGVLSASRVNATYVNRSRRNLTLCVAALGHDAASYHGHIIVPPT